MFATHIYLNGDCKEAIELYQSAFGAALKTLIEDPDSRRIVHAEIMIHDKLLILNDFGNNDGVSKSGGYQLCVQFKDEEDLEPVFKRDKRRLGGAFRAALPQKIAIGQSLMSLFCLVRHQKSLANPPFPLLNTGS